MLLEQRKASAADPSVLAVLQESAAKGAIDPFYGAGVEAAYSIMVQLVKHNPASKQRVSEIHSSLAVAFLSLKPVVAPAVVDLMHHVSTLTSSGGSNSEYQEWLIGNLKNQAPRLDLLARLLLRAKGTAG